MSHWNLACRAVGRCDLHLITLAFDSVDQELGVGSILLRQLDLSGKDKKRKVCRLGRQDK